MTPIVDAAGRTVEAERDDDDALVNVLVDGVVVARLTAKDAADLGTELSRAATRTAAAELGSLTIGEVAGEIYDRWVRARRAGGRGRR